MKSSESKTPPNGIFFTLINMINQNYHLVENQFRETMLPCLRYTHIHYNTNNSNFHSIAKPHLA